MPRELPPRQPRAFFGRDELVDQIVGLAENLTPLALIGAGGIGKTSIALALLHNDRIKKRFGEDRRFIRCDQFPASLSRFLHRLSAVMGAGVENPKDLTPLLPFLSSKEMLIVLDNAESILDPEGMDSQEIYDVVEELSRFDNICLCITSRISTIPPNCETLDIPTLTMEAARDAFYGIYRNGKRSDVVDKVLEQLDFHPLSINLLATVAHHNKWDTNRVTREWESQRTAVLRTDHRKSLSAAIELSLASPMFQELGPDARALLEVVAFFPQGVDENNLDWLFPSISNRKNVFDKFYVLSLTYRNGGFVTMLAPLRDHFCPKDRRPSPLLCATKECYFSRLSVDVNPGNHGFEETRWVVSEDVNIEHLLDAFMSTDTDSDCVWDACASFTRHLYWHKPRFVVLGPKIERLSDGHPSKPGCLFSLSRLFDSVGNYAESKRLLFQTLKLWLERGNDLEVARTLTLLAYTNHRLALRKEGIPQAKEALEIFERLNDAAGQADSLRSLALLFAGENQPDAAEEAASRASKLSLDEDGQSQVCEHHHILRHLCHSRGETEAAIGHTNTALRIASSPGLLRKKAAIIPCLMGLLLEEGRFEDAQAHVERLKSNAVGDTVNVGLATTMQAFVWSSQGRLEEAKSELSCAIGLHENIGLSGHLLETSRGLLRAVEEEMNDPVTPDESDDDDELLGAMLLFAPSHSSHTESK